jgi:hypothetical protein
MNFIKTYVSAYAAEKETGFDNTQISAVCNYKRKTTFGYVWRFVNEYTEEQYQNDLNTDFHNKYDKTPKRIAQLDLSGNLVKEFESISKASKETGVSRYSIQDYLRGNVKSPKQYRWEYRD